MADLPGTNEDIYLKMFECNYSVMLVVDSESGDIIDANMASCTYYGYDYSEITNMHMHRISLLNRNEIMTELRAVRHERIRFYVSRHILANDEIRDVEIYSTPLTFEKKEYLFFIVHDITERKAIDKKILESELKYKTLVNSTYDCEFWIDKSGKYNYISPSCEHLTGYKPDDYLNDPEVALHLVHHEDYDKVKKHLSADYIKSTSICKYEYKLISRKGELKWVLHICRPVIFNDEFLGRRGTDRDITKQKKVQLALVENQQKMRLVIENADAIIFTIDSSQTITFCEGRALKLLNTTSKELIGKPSHVLFGNALDDIFVKTLQGGLTNKTISINDLYFDISLVPQIKKSNEQIGITGIAVDSTSRVKSEMEFEQYKEHLENLVNIRTSELASVNTELALELEKQKSVELRIKQALEKEIELNELKTRFLSTISHEFRTPLTLIFSSAELLEMFGRKWEGKKYDVFIERIKNSVEYLLQLMEDVSVFNKSDIGKLKPVFHEINLYDFCHGLIAEVKTLSKEKHKMKLECSLSKKQYLLDKKILKIILTNLLANSIKYSPGGSCIKLKIKEECDRLKFEVKDNGIGIPEEELKYIYDTFFRAKNVGNTRGSGLGLAIVKKYLELLEGNISVRSKLNQGTSFIFFVPIK